MVPFAMNDVGQARPSERKMRHLELKRNLKEDVQGVQFYVRLICTFLKSVSKMRDLNSFRVLG